MRSFLATFSNLVSAHCEKHVQLPVRVKPPRPEYSTGTPITFFRRTTPPTLSQ